MKKGISISLAILFLAAILNLSVVTHFCEGKKVYSKLSLTAESDPCCPSDSDDESLSYWIYLTGKCCDDLIITCGIDSNYNHSVVFIPGAPKYDFKILAFTAKLNVIPENLIHTNTKPESPPGVMMSTSVDLSNICVLRI